MSEQSFFRNFMGVKIHFICGDLSQLGSAESTCAIVTSANINVWPSPAPDTVERRIFEAVGDDLNDKPRRIQDGVDVGNALMTGPGRLGVNHVIHAFPSLYKNIDPKFFPDLDKQLVLSYQNALSLAESNQVEMVALPLLGTGGYSWERDQMDIYELGLKAIFEFIAKKRPEKIKSLYLYANTETQKGVQKTLSWLASRIEKFVLSDIKASILQSELNRLKLNMESYGRQLQEMILQHQQQPLPQQQQQQQLGDQQTEQYYFRPSPSQQQQLQQLGPIPLQRQQGQGHRHQFRHPSSTSSSQTMTGPDAPVHNRDQIDSPRSVMAQCGDIGILFTGPLPP
ncbi:Appr-1-p processing domain containing protein [Nitzschia inconspicua]|uniref:Appr-1-p processing domain containing protein n=1 Tax=Nitzschia inconspicua TaxID=303405 RepID=A0A9K3PRV3_9STRA|nr:Appr-1-p processing domain containing protein [Nitzschia inconspicua]